MAGHGAVGGLVFIVAVRAHQHAGHHGKAAEGGGDHVAHHVAVVVLAGPDKAALTAHHAGHRVVDQSVEVFDARGLELLLILLLVDLGKDVLEGVVVFLADGILGGEPQVLFGGQSIVKAAAGKALDGGILVVGALQHTGALEVIDGLAHLGAVRAGEHQLGLAGAGNAELGALVHVAVGMTGNGDGLFPGLDHRLDAVQQDGRTEHGAVQHGADGAVGALPHLVQVILGHALGVGGDGGALDRHAVLLVGQRRVHGHLVAGGVPVGQAQVVIFGVQLHKGAQQLLLDPLPQHAGHLVAVHLHQRGGHLDLFHRLVLSFCLIGANRPRYAPSSRNTLSMISTPCLICSFVGVEKFSRTLRQSASAV